jgi:hypothetical protein
MTIYSTSNLPKFLNSARDDGWTVLGAAADVPDGAAAGGGGRDDEDSDSNEHGRDDDDNEWDLGDDDDAGPVSSGADAGAARPDRHLPRPRCLDLDEARTGKPTIIVLGSEGELRAKGRTQLPEASRRFRLLSFSFHSSKCPFPAHPLTLKLAQFLLVFGHGFFAGRGLRTLVARACTGFVRIPGGGGGMAGGDAGAEEGKTRSGVDSLNVSVTGGILLWHFLSRQ